MTGSSSNFKQNRLKQLRAFIHTAQTGSISKAAERLYLSQPSISLQIKALEEELGTTLFERRGPKIQITPAGKILLDLTQPLVEGMDTLPEVFASQLGEVDTGTLDIAAGESTILYILPQFVDAFCKAYPSIQVRLHNVTGRDGMSMLKADEVDFAVGSMLEPVEDINYYPIFSYDPVLITPPDHPLAQRESVSLHDISPYGLILPPRHLSTWRMVKLVFQQHNADYKIALEAGGWEVIKKYVELGMGVSIVTDICLNESDKVARIPLNRYFPKRSYGVVMRRGKFISPQARRFLEILHADLGDKIDPLSPNTKQSELSPW
ncbi:transcriptional regulator, LysR family [gamma proteobacterium HTCC5015]|nr:transcriptional regulator, LysR family [gamma proteobacterium HTCC5015]